MWLTPLFPWIARLGAFTYYRMRYDGAAVPRDGPVLLVANHPNSLLDPMLVAAAARRPVRFLAKAPLFADVKISWLIRAVGAIPVYRRADDPAQMDRNEEMFRAVHTALADGAAVGIFPEGLSHNEPSLAPLRTGAARIALGAHALIGRPFPVVPVGLVFRQRSVPLEALVLVGGRCRGTTWRRSGRTMKLRCGPSPAASPKRCASSR
jgi:1-acyl-sn-glycerol-3-phosphate acyltransferase